MKLPTSASPKEGLLCSGIRCAYNEYMNTTTISAQTFTLLMNEWDRQIQIQTANGNTKEEAVVIVSQMMNTWLKGSK